MQSVHKNLFTILLVSIFLISLVSADTVYQQSRDAEVIIVCINAGFCSASAQCNVSVFDPDNVALVSGIEATQSADLAFYNVSLNSTQTAKLGEYTVAGFCKDGSVTQVVDFSIFVTISGTMIENPAILYAALLLILFLLDLLIFYFIFLLDSKNPTDPEGIFQGVSIQKYARMVLIGISYGAILLTINLMNAASASMSDLSQFTGIFGGLFSLMLNASWIWTISIVIWMLITVWKDHNLIKWFEKTFKDLENTSG